MSSIQERRQQILSEKLREMGDIGVKTRTPEESPSFDPPVDLGAIEDAQKPEAIPEETAAEQPQAITEQETASASPPKDPKPRVKKDESTATPGVSFEQYSARFLVSVRTDGSKSGFTIRSSILQLLRDILRAVRARITLTAYIENILLDHLKTHQSLLNKAADRHKRNPTINL